MALGSSYSNSEIELILKKNNLKYKKLSEKDIISSAARALNERKIIGWFQGRCEFGPRALGNRSILCRPSPKSMKTKVNMIKIREQFRPFAGSILQDHVHEYFEVPEEKYLSPYMNYCFVVKKEKRKELAAIVHTDNTCRIQTVSLMSENVIPTFSSVIPALRIGGGIQTKIFLYSKLLKEFYKLSGIPCLLNTSFNLKGEPIVESPEQAVKDFMKTRLDILFIGSFVVHRE